MLTSQLRRGALALGKAVRDSYRSGQTDYSLEPIILTDKQDHPLGCIQEGDAVIFCCRRGEREIQLTEAFTDAAFDRFPRPPLPDLNFVILTLYHEKFKDLPVAFAPTKISDTLADVIGRAGLRQLHTAESEKFAHVTFFFNGGNSQPFVGEDDIRIPSPKGIPFDQAPELSLPQVTEQVLLGVEKRYDFIITNFANGDVIGHTANNAAKIECAAIVDAQLGHVVKAALANDYIVFVTADHGNLEEMIHADGSPHVAHTSNLVQYIALDLRSASTISLRDGTLADARRFFLLSVFLSRRQWMA
jgi:2,3-bisphosphoglycerate-independent phosphoglycerate mutase